MAVSNKLVNKKFIKDYTRERLWQLNKDDFKHLLNKHEIEFKKSASKDDLIQLLLDSKIDMWEVYKYGKCCCFGMYAYELEEMLSIDSKLRAKLQKKDILKVAYQNKSSYGGNSVVNFYDLECLYKMSKVEWEEYKSKYAIKPLTQKQLDAIAKRKETLKLKAEEERKLSEQERIELAEQTVCDICNNSTMDFGLLREINGKSVCIDCIDERDYDAKYNDFIENVFRKIYYEKDKCIIMDIETTNLAYNDICSVSAINFDGTVLLDTLVKPNGIISSGATMAHGITNEMTNVYGMDAQQLYKEIKEILSIYKKVIFYNVGPNALKLYFNAAGISSNSFTDNADNVNKPKGFISEDVFDYMCGNKNHYYSSSIVSYVGGNAEEFGLPQDSNHSLIDCFRIKKGIEKFAKAQLRELKF